MAGSPHEAAAPYGYMILREGDDGHWHEVGEADHRHGLTARAGRSQAVRDAAGETFDPDAAYAALPKDQWRTALET
jgi:hypothetical protein